MLQDMLGDSALQSRRRGELSVLLHHCCSVSLPFIIPALHSLLKKRRSLNTDNIFLLF